MINKSNLLEDHPSYIEALTESPALFPSAVNIELTTYCNLKCIMCPKTSGIARTPANQTIQPHVLKKITEEIIPNVARIDLVGDGEIFIEPELVEKILDAASRYKVLVNASTNGILMREDICHLLIDKHLHDLNISVDAGTHETYKIIRQADFSILLSNLECLHRLKIERNSKFPHLHFSVVGMKSNIHELPDVVRLAAKYGVESVTLQAMGEFAPVENQSIFLRDKKQGKHFYEIARNLGSDLGVRVELWPESQFEDTPENQSSVSNGVDISARKDCYFPWEVPYIDTNGGIRACCAIPPLGDLNKSSFIEVWNDKPYSTLRQTIRSPNPPFSCRNCPGRGWYLPEPCQSTLIPGKNDRQLGTGWYNLEVNNNEPFRWTRSQSTLFLQGDCDAVVTLDLQSPSEFHCTPQLTVEIDRTNSFPVDFLPGERNRLAFPVKPAASNLHLIKLKGNTWRPVDVIPGNLDPRSLSVKFFGAKLEGFRINARFSDAIVLYAVDIPKIQTFSEKDVKIKLFWQMPTALPDGLTIFVHLYKGSLPGKIECCFTDILRRFRIQPRFQTDRALPAVQNPLLLLSQELCIPIPQKITKGIYSIWIGVHSIQKGRLNIDSTVTKTYRNSVYCGNLHLTA